MQLLLMHEDIRDVVEDDTVDALDQPQNKIWQQQNAKAIALIGLCLANSLIHHVDFTSTAKEI